MSVEPQSPGSELEASIRAHGLELSRRTAQRRHGQGAAGWLRTLLRRLNRRPDFRIRALRFIDVLPALTDDATIVRLFDEHFGDQEEFPLPAVGRLALGARRLLSEHQLAAAIRGAIEILARQFMIAPDPASIEKTLGTLEPQGRLVSFDLLGERTLSDGEAEQYLQDCLRLLDHLAASASGPLNLSVKLSSLHPRLAAERIDASVAALLPRLIPLLRAAREREVSVTLDMEDTDLRPVILAVFRRLALGPELRDWPGLGIALQAYLTNGERDLKDMLELAGERRVPFGIRLVRGAYWDQEVVTARLHGWPVPVWERQAETDRAYERGTLALLAAAPKVYPAIATHNPRSLAVAMAETERLGLGHEQFEFQMLYGMSTPSQLALADMGYRLRSYVPCGELIPGMAYLVRRLLENASSQSLERWELSTEAGDSPFAPPEAGPGQSPVGPDTESAAGSGFGNTPVHSWRDPRQGAQFQARIDQVRADLGRHFPLMLGGSWEDTEARIESFNPASADQMVGSTASAGREHADRAVAFAGEAFPDWRARSAGERAGLLRATADLLEERRDELAAWEILEAGKSWREADADICEALDFMRYYADQAERLGEERRLRLSGEDNRCFYQPRGVGVVIPPWNFPLALLTGMLSATLVTGNCAILKPSSETPVVAARLVELFLQAGIPPGVLAFLPGPGGEVGDYLVGHPGVHLITFTGSRSVGTGILRRAAEPFEDQTHIKRVIAELGGKNAIIVDDSADPDEAIAGILHSAFSFQGQKCSACSRVIVVGGQYREFSRRLSEAVDSLVMGDPADPACDLGPVINGGARTRIHAAIERGRQSGELIYQGRDDAPGDGYYVAPAVFGRVDPDSELAQEEIFGPVLALMLARDLDEALAIANGTRYALTGGIYSRSPASQERAAREFRVGNLYINRGITGALVNRQPFGGFGMSGVGNKTGGPDYLLQYLEPRCVTENTLRQGVAPLVRK